ncbi:MAG: gephyrin-like molybdotransferase Glp [Vicinamibacterales bacterium]
MRPFTSTISIDEARALLRQHAHAITRTEAIDLLAAAGRVVSADVVSDVVVPPFARSAMDGYAVRAADTRGANQSRPVRLEIVERIFTGSLPSQAVDAWQCAEIATGAPIPVGADAVVMVEQTRPAGDTHVDIAAEAVPGQNIGRAGADISLGDVVVRRGDVLNPSRLGAVAAIGCARLEVFAAPRVAIVSTGNEVVRPGTLLRPGQIHDVNGFTLSAVARAHGCEPEVHAPAIDTLGALEQVLDSCRDADVIVFSGGSSVGDRDLVLDLVRRRGHVVFHGIAVKPGKPTLFGVVEEKPVFGMPGNPTSCLSNAYILLAPFLRATARLPVYEPRIVHARLARTIVSQAGRHQFYTVRLEQGEAVPAFKGSGDITSLSRADGYIEIPADADTVAEGTLVQVTLF